MSTSLSTVFIDRLMNLSPVFLVLILIPLVSFKLSTLLILLLVILLVVFVALVAFLILSMKYKQRVVSFIEHSLFFIPKGIRKRALDFVDRFVDGVAVLRDHPRNLIPVAGLTLIIIFFDGASFYMLFRALGASPPFTRVFFGYTLLNLTFILPMPPGQVGTNEMLMLLIFHRGLEMDEDMANSVMACGHVLTFLLMSVLGIVSLRVLGVSMREALSESEEVDVAEE
jgi:uncharacterized protein (TIRG00374 family)